MDELEQFKKTFYQECDELLGAFESQLLALIANPGDVEAVNAAFRAVHSIKGGAAAFGFNRLVEFAHVFETVLDLMRGGRITINEGLVEACLRAGDVIADLVQAVRTGIELEPHFEAHVAALLTATAGLDPKRAAYSGKPAKAPRIAADSSPGNHQPVRYAISFRPHLNLLRRAGEPLLIMRNLKELGSVKVTADLSSLPPLADLVPTDAYLGWTIELETAAGLAQINEIFEFVEGSCALEIRAMDAAPADPLIVGDPAGLPQTESTATVSVNPPDAQLDASVGTPTPAPAPAQNQRLSTIRVDLDRVDRLVNLVGEVAIAHAMVLQQIDQTLIDHNPQLFQSLSQLMQHTRSLQDSVMAIRAQPIRSIFSRMPRIARDLALQTGKKITLETSGETTEIDKTIIEELSDPLVHIIRNAVDHGIEPVEERLRIGKPAHGTIRLSAAQRGNRIVIQVSDDGRGIDRAKIRRTALAMNMIESDAQLTDEETDNLIFLPGLSTAKTLSNISGRGVGMDVVYRNLQKLGGRVSLRSEEGRGTTMVLTLPLTLAVLDGMIIRAGHESYVIPLGNIIECMSITPQQVKTIPGSGEVLDVRGVLIKLVRLRKVFNLQNVSKSSQLLVILVELESKGVIGLVVDEIVGQQQIVIKSIRENFQNVPGIAGATILGDGAVVLILDVTAISELPSARRAPQLQPDGHAQLGNVA